MIAEPASDDDDAPVARASWRTWGTSVGLAVHAAGAVTEAVRLLEEELAAMDAACNRFRPDSDLSSVNRAAGRPVRVGALCVEALTVARRAAERTGGAVDPTVGSALYALGYDRDFDELSAVPPTAHADDAIPVPHPAAGWRTILLDPDRGTVVVPWGVALDLGATAKALCADRAARRIAGDLGCGVVVDLGGDLSVGGPPPAGGWQVALVEDARRGVLPAAGHGGSGHGAAGHAPASPDGEGGVVQGELARGRQSVSLWRGGLATSGTSVRRWRRAGRQLHHIVDPASGWPAPSVWAQVTVAASSCVDANTAATAAVVWGEEAPFRVAQMGLAACFVPAGGGPVVEVGGWPADDR